MQFFVDQTHFFLSKFKNFKNYSKFVLQKAHSDDNYNTKTKKYNTFN